MRFSGWTDFRWSGLVASGVGPDGAERSAGEVWKHPSSHFWRWELTDPDDADAVLLQGALPTLTAARLSLEDAARLHGADWQAGDESIARWMVRRAAELDLSHAELARRAQVTATTISRIANEERQGAQSLRALERVLGRYDGRAPAGRPYRPAQRTDAREAVDALGQIFGAAGAPRELPLAARVGWVLSRLPVAP